MRRDKAEVAVIAKRRKPTMNDADLISDGAVQNVSSTGKKDSETEAMIVTWGVQNYLPDRTPGEDDVSVIRSMEWLVEEIK